MKFQLVSISCYAAFLLVTCTPRAPIDPLVDSGARDAASTDAASKIAASTPLFPKWAPIKRVVNKRILDIQFASGSSDFSPDAQMELKRLYDDLVLVPTYAIELHGHTDNVGDPGENLLLSEQRAIAVRDWLRQQDATAFPTERFTIVPHGGQEPIASNLTVAGRSKNRRIVLVLGYPDK